MLRVSRLIGIFAVLALWFGLVAPTSAEPIAGANFNTTWARTDKPVAASKVNRTWMWGPQANTPALSEPYAEAPGGTRTVQYFDKTRMEDNSWSEASAPWNVTNGLLAKELITGQLQLGDDTFEQHAPAQINVAGDANDPNGPTYATFNSLMNFPSTPTGWEISQTVDRAGNIDIDGSLSDYNVISVDVGAPTHHNVASVFWDFMNSSGTVFDNGSYTNANLFQNPFYATGYPLTGAFWTHVLVGGVKKLVLVQVFERRVLTYTPSNPDGWKVEAGNVGQHYYTWRYNILGKTPVPVQTTPPSSQSAYVQTKVLAYPSDFDPTTAFPALDPQGRIWVAGLSTTAHPALLRYDGLALAHDWSQVGSVSAFLRLDAVHAPNLYTIDVTKNAVDVIKEVDSQHVSVASQWFPDMTVSDLATDGAENVYLVGPPGTLEKYTSDGQWIFNITLTGMSNILGVTVDASNHVFVVGSNATSSGTVGKLVQLDTAGQVVRSWNTKHVYNFVRVDPAGNIYLGQFKGSEIDKFDTSGNEVARIGVGVLSQLASFDVADSGAVVAADPNGIHIFATGQ